MKHLIKIVTSSLFGFFTVLVFVGTANAFSLDTSYGNQGIADTTVLNSTHEAKHLGLQSDDKVIVGGHTTNGSYNIWKFERYNTDGTLDTTFGSGGVTTKDFGYSSILYGGILVQNDDKIVAADIGFPGHGANVGRFNADGSVDTSFGNNGFVTLNLPLNETKIIWKMIEQADHKILLAGSISTNNGGNSDALVVRFLPDGSYDTTFGTNGIVRIDYPAAQYHFIGSLDLQSTGKIILFGGLGGVGGDPIITYRFNTDGSLDTSFGDSGVVNDHFNTFVHARDVVVQPDDKIVVVGTSDPGNAFDRDTYVIRYTAEGVRDASFADNGLFQNDFATPSSSAHSVVLQQDGKIVIGGYHGASEQEFPVVRRLNADGTLDTAFGTNGSIITDVGSPSLINTVKLQSDGKIVAGTGKVNTSMHVLRYAQNEQTEEFAPSADTYVRQGHNDQNEGGGQFIRVQNTGNNRALVRFDQNELQASVGGNTVLSATLRLTIADIANNWGSTGRTIDAHRVIVDWAEGNGTESDRGTGPGATWNCAIDSAIQNQATDCSGNTAWEMGQPNNPQVHPWVEAPTATQLIVNDQTGVVEFDVTGDVAAFLSGSTDNFGWIIKKTNEGQNGKVSFGSRESASAPQLVITYQ